MRIILGFLAILFLATIVVSMVAYFQVFPSKPFVYPDPKLTTGQFLKLMRTNPQYAPFNRYSDMELSKVWDWDKQRSVEYLEQKHWDKELIDKHIRINVIEKSELGDMYYIEYSRLMGGCLAAFLAVGALILILAGVHCCGGRMALYHGWGDFILSAFSSSVVFAVMYFIILQTVSASPDSVAKNYAIPLWLDAIVLLCLAYNIFMVYRMNGRGLFVNTSAVAFRLSFGAILGFLAMFGGSGRRTVNGRTESEEAYDLRRSNPFNILSTMAILAAIGYFIYRLIEGSRDFMEREMSAV